MQMTNVIINFRRHLKRRNYSPHTVKYYLNILKQFVIWLDVAIEQITDKKIDAYIDYLHDKRMQPASINCYLAIIRVFYTYLKYEEQVNLTNPVKAGRRLRVAKPLPRPLREDQIDPFFDVIKSKRDWAIVNDRPKGAAHVRLNGATFKWQKWGSRRVSNLAFFTPFRNSIFFRFFTT